jgi:hypothetical protein
MPTALALAAAASFVELGPIALVLRGDPDLVSILLAGFAYQLANVLPGPSDRMTPLASVAVAAVGAAGLIYATIATAPWFASIAALSWSLQAVRRRLTAKPGDDLPKAAEKRAARVIGFILATVMPSAVWLPLVAVAILVALRAATNGHLHASPCASGAGASNGIPIAMVLHQAHYFSYCYAVPMLLASSPLGGIAAAGFWFACGWVSYLSAEGLWRRFAPIPVFVIGHLFVAIVLMLLTLFGDNPWGVVLLWILSGLGGGTVYCLTLLHKRAGGDQVRLEHAEGVGHILGITVALAGATSLNWTAGTLPLVGAAWAIAAGGTIFALAWRARHAGTSFAPRGGTHAGD